MTASETEPEIPADVRELARRILRSSVGYTEVVDEILTDLAFNGLEIVSAARIASLEALIHEIASDCRSPTAHAGNALRQIGDKIGRALDDAPDRAASLEATGCMCRDVPIGSHKASVIMELPDHMAATRVARVEAGLSPKIALDACLVEEVRDLWSTGIRTTGCCCGHNRMAGYIGVEASDIQAMKAMGYVVRENSSRPSDEDSFVPKSVRLSASLEAERARTVEAYRVGVEETCREWAPPEDWSDAELTQQGLDARKRSAWVKKEMMKDWRVARALALASEKGGQADG